MENRRTLLAIVLILIVWSGFNFFFPVAHKKGSESAVSSKNAQIAKKTPPAPRVVRPVTPVTQPAPVVVTPPSPVVEITAHKIAVSSHLFNLVFTTNGARLIDAQLNLFKKTNSPDSAAVKLIDNEPLDSGSYGISGGKGLFLPQNLIYTFVGNRDRVSLSAVDKTDLTFQAITPDNLKITKIFTFYPNKYYFDLNVIIENLSSSSVKGSVNLSLLSKWDAKQKAGRYSFIGSVTFNGKKLLNDDPKDLKKSTKSYGNNTLWTSFTNKYFADIVKPYDDSIDSLNVSYVNNYIVNNISSAVVNLAPSENKDFKYTGYIGPKEYDLLKEPGLSFERIIDLGFFGIIAKPLMLVLKFFYGFLGNYGFAIVLLTVCIKVLFWPLTHKSYSSMNDMKKLQPQMQKLRAKHGKDKQKLNKEMMSLYKENRVNPFGGCLPMLVQIPVFFALYRVLLETIELRHAPFIFWITDLSAPDTLISHALGLGFALGPLPLIMGFTMFLQQKMTPSTMDPTQAKVMLFMPVFFTFIFLSFPSGLVIYWLVNNLLTIAQQYLINRKPA